MLTQINRLQGRHVHMNLIRVGIESFTPADETEIDGAVQFTRDTYARSTSASAECCASSSPPPTPTAATTSAATARQRT